MRALWNGIRTNSVPPAMAAFFPKHAYEQVKTLGDPVGDWENRLVLDYRLDIHSAHALLGAHAGQAHLLSVQVPSDYAHWIDPGGCYNQVGYYEVPNSRVVYSEDGQVHSFGIASMISWRGVWYVIHLGAVMREGDVGELDDPSEGPGTPLDSSTC